MKIPAQPVLNPGSLLVSLWWLSSAVVTSGERVCVCCVCARACTHAHARMWPQGLSEATWRPYLRWSLFSFSRGHSGHWDVLRAGCSSHTGSSVHSVLGHPLPDSKCLGARLRGPGSWTMGPLEAGPGPEPWLWAVAEATTEGCLWPTRLQPEIGPAGHRAPAGPTLVRPGNVGIYRAKGRRPLSGKQVYFGAFGRQGRK